MQDGQGLLFEVALLQQVVPAAQDGQEDVVDDLFGDPAAAQVDLREVVEELLVSQEKASKSRGRSGGAWTGWPWPPSWGDTSVVTSPLPIRSSM